MKLDVLAWMKTLVLSCIVFCVLAQGVIGAPATTDPTKTEDQLKLEEKERLDKAAANKKAGKRISDVEVSLLTFPEDKTTVMTAKQLTVTGNTLIETEEILANIPTVFSTSDLPLHQADSSDLYDFRPVRAIIETPGQAKQITARTISGVTKCILSMYADKGYSGIFVEVPGESLDSGKLRGDVLHIHVTEAPVKAINTNYFTPDNTIAEKGYLKESFLVDNTPVKVGEVGKQRELEEYVNLLNLNPDRYISARISKGSEPDTLNVNYNVYEADPWHWFIQLDNSGTKDRRYAPRVGLINTNLFGIDDTLTVYYQAPWEKGIEDRYSAYGSYDLPIMGPKLRLEVFGGYSQFDIDGGTGIDFLGHGSVIGGRLRYNVAQFDGWFFDVTSSISQEESVVKSSIFNSIFGSEVRMDLWGIGVDLNKQTDLSNTSIIYNRIRSVGGSDQDTFWDSATSTGARTNADGNFAVNNIAISHSQFTDETKIHRLSGSFRWIIPENRLAPAKMTTFGGMYTVRGYKESGLVADGGVLASAQYEYDLIKQDAYNGNYKSDAENPYEIKRLAPLAFFDYGRTDTREAIAGFENANEEMYSVGTGVMMEIGKNFTGALYYGWPLKATSTTDTEDGRLNFGVMMRW